MHLGFYIDPATNDLALDATGNLAMARDAEAVGQHVRQRLLTHEGEWFLDTTAGLPWFARLLGRQFDAELAEALVKAEIADTDGVTEIEAMSVTFDRTTRGMSLHDFAVSTIYDEVPNG
ncbi:hypothetical protein [Tropicimonas sp. IMCC34011]|uniref:hypothetical protein n=1 Tax=Tropicimonas sp. IMCC34011 TaxID=2248759 RepID=UPI000E23669B|nr:hypothetical protein [Tropicimonas sp. IMCC34011]